jgi:hypothetical protein
MFTVSIPTFTIPQIPALMACQSCVNKSSKNKGKERYKNSSRLGTTSDSANFYNFPYLFQLAIANHRENRLENSPTISLNMLDALRSYLLS